MDAMMVWILTFLLNIAPYGNCNLETCMKESKADYEQRVAAILDAAAAIVFDENEEPMYQGSPWAREQSLMDVLAVAHHESIGFRKDVDEGKTRGDHGASVCLMGIMVGSGTAEGYSMRELIGSRHTCFAVGYHRMKASRRICGYNQHGLAAYASGSCQKGRKVSSEMVEQGQRWFSALKQGWIEGHW